MPRLFARLPQLCCAKIGVSSSSYHHDLDSLSPTDNTVLLRQDTLLTQTWVFFTRIYPHWHPLNMTPPFLWIRVTHMRLTYSLHYSFMGLQQNRGFRSRRDSPGGGLSGAVMGRGDGPAGVGKAVEHE